MRKREREKEIKREREKERDIKIRDVLLYFPIISIFSLLFPFPSKKPVSARSYHLSRENPSFAERVKREYITILMIIITDYITGLAKLSGLGSYFT